MSASAEILQNIANKPQLNSGSPAKTASADAALQADNSLLPLIRQVFFQHGMLRRRRIFFAAADRMTRVSSLTERIAKTLGAMNVSVGLVESDAELCSEYSLKKPPRAIHEADSVRSGEPCTGVSRVPWALVEELTSPGGAGLRDLQFDCILFGGTVSGSTAPLFANLCDAAVLVLTSGQTRRDAALQAKQSLDQLNLEVVGLVLEGRTFPIPESIYCRL